jgi:uncharacterized protein YqhQ
MRAPHSYCVAVRTPSGEIVTREMPIARVSEKHKIFKYPVFRGIGTLGQAMSLGVKALRFSANAALETDKLTAKKQEISNLALTLNLVVSLAFFIFLYKLIPLFGATWLEQWFPALQGRVAFNATDGVIRLGIFLIFLLLVSRLKDIRRVFQYHGAEHKVVFAFESGKPVTVENARQYPTWHPRCGTSFLLVVMLVSMGVYTLVPFDGFLGKFAARVFLLPIVAGLSYEVIRFAGKHRASALSVLTAPGLWLQRVTTKPPSDEQTEVAVEALERAMVLEKAQGGELVIA